MSNPANPRANKPLNRAKALFAQAAQDSTKKRAAPVDTVRLKRSMARDDSVYRANAETTSSDQPGNTITVAKNARGRAAVDSYRARMDSLAKVRR